MGMMLPDAGELGLLDLVAFWNGALEVSGVGTMLPDAARLGSLEVDVVFRQIEDELDVVFT